MITGSLADWLLDSDPALRWQVERDLLGDPPEVWQTTRARVPVEGFGARLLALQGDDGQWAGGAFFPADFDFGGSEAQPGAGQPYTATTWALNDLRDWGVPAAALAGTAEKLAANSRWEYDGSPYWHGEVDCCINAWTLMNGTWLGVDMAPLAQWFVDHQQAEGGWNCEWVDGSVRSSTASTLNSLKAVLFYEQSLGTPAPPALAGARRRGEEYLLARRLMFRLSTGEQIDESVTRLAYPFRWFYSALNALDYFRAASLHAGSTPDPRLADAVESVRAQRQPDGTWLQARRHPGRVWFEVDAEVGEPSKWLTFFAERVLNWWDTL